MYASIARMRELEEKGTASMFDKALNVYQKLFMYYDDKYVGPLLCALGLGKTAGEYFIDQMIAPVTHAVNFIQVGQKMVQYSESLRSQIHSTSSRGHRTPNLKYREVALVMVKQEFDGEDPRWPYMLTHFFTDIPAWMAHSLMQTLTGKPMAIIRDGYNYARITHFT